VGDEALAAEAADALVDDVLADDDPEVTAAAGGTPVVWLLARLDAATFSCCVAA